MNKHTYIKFATYIFSFILLFSSCSNPNLTSVNETNIDATVFPDYSGITIPSNIAPLNFLIKNQAEGYFVEITGNNGPKIKISSNDGNIQIPIKKWGKLVSNNLNSDFKIDIYTKQNNKWQHFNSIINHIASESIDGYLVYRFINSANILWSSMGIYQRNLQNFEVSPIMDNSLTDKNCMHCHSFASNNSNSFMFHMRGKPGGTIIYSNNKLSFVDTKTEHTISAGGYPSWHPNGKLIAFSTNKIQQKFHAAQEKYAFVYDEKSDIILYDVEKNQVQAIPKLTQSDFENMPTWSPDGKYLYFLSTPEYKSDTANYQDIKYDLKRIGYDVPSNTWGDIEMIISSKEIGKSVAFPRVSPDNRYVVLCLADYGYFTVYNETSDIAYLDLQTMKITKPDINTEYVESYPSWSSNGKWILFNSKRADGISSRPYFSYFNEGKAYKPFILPQEYALWNFEELKNINRPELVSSRVPLSPQEILNLVKNTPVHTGFDMKSLTKIPVKHSMDKVNTDSTFNFDQ